LDVKKSTQRVFLAVLGSLSLLTTYASAANLSDFDRMLSEYRSMDLLVPLVKNEKTPELINWLERRASEGHAIPQYALALRYSNEGNKAATYKWYAMARLTRLLDGTQCDPSKSVGIEVMVDVATSKIDEQAQKDLAPFSEAMEYALKQERAGAMKQPPYWICDPDNPRASEASLLPEAKRKDQRQRQLARLTQRFIEIEVDERLSRDLNPGHLPIRTLDGKYFEGKQSASFNKTMVWLDNERLLIAGYLEGATPNITGRPVYEWNVQSGQVTRVADEGVNLCRFDDFVSFYATKNDRIVWREGPIGNIRSSDLAHNAFIGRFKCRRMEKPPTENTSRVHTLEHGGRISYARGPLMPAEFEPSGQSAFLKLPFSPSQLSQYTTGIFSEYRKAYVYEYDYTERPLLLKLWTVQPDGQTETIDIPNGPWATLSSRYRPVNGGWLISTVTKGIYFWQGDRVVKLFNSNASFDDTEVSPNGCRAAVRVRESNGTPTKIIEFCKTS
jgi:hypothetical protein